MNRALRWMVLLVALAGALVSAAPAFSAPTIVSLTFDDGHATQLAARPLLDEHAMKGTFYINSGLVGQPGMLTWPQIQQLRAAGHEIGGHTLDHVDLLTVDLAEARRQVCDDRAALLARGYPATSFAYPYGSRDATIKAVAQECGYNSGRRAWGLRDASCDICLPAETIPPRDAYSTRTPSGIVETDSLATIQSYVTQAEDAGGGWVQLIFHHVCDGCDRWSITEARLAAFLEWLKAREGQGTVVRTVHEVMGGPVHPSPDTTAPESTIACGGSTCSTGWYTSSVAVTLAATDTGGSGVAAIRYTLDGSEPTPSSTLYAGAFTVSTTTPVKYRAWDGAGNVEATRSQTIRVDSAAPTTAISCNGAPCAGSTYLDPVQVALAATDSGGSGVAAVRYTLDGSEPSPSSTLYTGPFTISTTTTVRYRAWDAAGNVEATKSQAIAVDAPTPPDPTPPQSSISCNGSTCSDGWYPAPVQIALSATDEGGSGVAAIRYTVDGSEPTASSTLYTGPFTISTTTTVRYRAWDGAGNVEATSSRLVRVDVTPPTVVLVEPQNGATVKGVVRLTADAVDSESGIVSVTFYLDGEIVGTSTNAPHRVNWNTKKSGKGQHTLWAVATDAAGNTTSSAQVVVTVQ